jgi:UDP-N-acetylmuramoyl-tripeptide--D-alanyl-D-alanine ligase
MREHLRLPSTQKGLFNPLELAKWLLLLLAFSARDYNVSIAFLFLVILLLENVGSIKEVRNHLFLRPITTVKSTSVVVFSFGLLLVSTFFLFWNLSDDRKIVALLINERFLFVFVAFSVLIFSPISTLLKKRKIVMAKKKRNEYGELVAVGITGSYGKSGTKNILAALIGTENVAVTPGNTNTEIGVADFLLKNVSAKTKYFVSEMGAYRIGEIGRLTTVVRPKIGIITAVTNQHLGLFGSLENIRKAKYELIQALPANGIAIFNADDAVCREFASQTKHCNVLTFGLHNPANITARITSSNESGIRATISGIVPEFDVFLPLFGDHQISNALAAIVAAISMGIGIEQIKERLATVHSAKGTMNVYNLNGATIIDDSYNANTVGVVAAIESLRKIDRKNKIIVLAPLTELGDNAGAQHEEIGKSLLDVASKVIYTSQDFASNVKQGMESTLDKFKLETNPQKLVQYVNGYLNNDSVILLEGRVPRQLREYLAKK